MPRTEDDIRRRPRRVMLTLTQAQFDLLKDRLAHDRLSAQSFLNYAVQLYLKGELLVPMGVDPALLDNRLVR